MAQDAETNGSTSKAGTIKVKFHLDYKSDTERVSQKGTHELIQDEELVFDLGKNELKLKYADSKNSSGKELKFKIQRQSDQRVLLEFSSPFSGFLQRSMGADQSEIRRFFVKIKELPIKK